MRAFRDCCQTESFTACFPAFDCLANFAVLYHFHLLSLCFKSLFLPPLLIFLFLTINPSLFLSRSLSFLLTPLFAVR